MRRSTGTPAFRTSSGSWILTEDRTASTTAARLREKLIPWCVYQAPTLLSDQLSEDLSVGGEGLYRRDVVVAHQATVAFHIGAQDSGQPPFDVRDGSFDRILIGTAHRGGLSWEFRYGIISPRLSLPSGDVTLLAAIVASSEQ
jgi:hypothetical protein